MDIDIDKLQALIEGCMADDTAMQRQFYDLYYPVMMRVSVRYAPSLEDAEQWVHDGLLKVFSNLDKFGFQGSFEGWVKKIITRVCLDNIRTNNAKKNEVEKNTFFNIDTDKAAVNLGVTNYIDDRIESEAIIEVLKRLPDRQRTVFNLYVFEEFNHKEIAKELEITETNSHWLLHQAKKHLKSVLTAPAKITI